MAKRYYTEDAVRADLLKRLEKRTMTSVAKEVGVKLQNLSVMKLGLPITGKVLEWLGYRAVKRMYERID